MPDAEPVRSLKAGKQQMGEMFYGDAHVFISSITAGRCCPEHSVPAYVFPAPLCYYSPAKTGKGGSMEWRVNDMFRQGKSSHYVLVLQADSLRIIAEATTRASVQAGDILFPVKNALYLINKEVEKQLKVHRAYAFSAMQWISMTRSVSASVGPSQH